MTTENKAKNLLQRINAVREEVAYIQKDKSVSTGGGSYKAVTHDMVTAVTRASLIKHGIVSWPNMVASNMVLPKEDAKQFRYEATYDFTFANADNPAETLTIRIEAHALDNGDKAPGKALSYAKKYALLKLLDIETGEDEESRVPQEFDAQPWLNAMEQAKDNAALTAAYEALKNAAQGKVDNADMRAYLNRRNELAKKLPMDTERFAQAIGAYLSGKVTKDAILTYNLTVEQRAQVESLQ